MLIESNYLEIPSYFSFRNFQYVRAHKLHYLAALNNHNETIICLHGLARNANDFSNLINELAADYNVISLDVAGRGNSDYLTKYQHYNYQTYYRDLCYLIKQLKLNNIHFIGSSMGGIMSMHYASKHPKKVSSIILNDVGPFMPSTPISKLMRFIGHDPEFASFMEAKNYFKRLCANWGIKNNEDWHKLTEASTYLTTNGAYKLKYDKNIFENYKKYNNKDMNLWQIWQKISCPIFVIKGEKSRFLDLDTYNKMLEKDQVTGTILKNIGHTPALMNPHEIELIANWLNNKKR